MNKEELLPAVKDGKDPNEIMAKAKENGKELSDDDLETIAGGYTEKVSNLVRKLDNLH